MTSWSDGRSTQMWVISIVVKWVQGRMFKIYMRSWTEDLGTSSWTSARTDWGLQEAMVMLRNRLPTLASLWIETSKQSTDLERKNDGGGCLVSVDVHQRKHLRLGKSELVGKYCVIWWRKGWWWSKLNTITFISLAYSWNRSHSSGPGGESKANTFSGCNLSPEKATLTIVSTVTHYNIIGILEVLTNTIDF